VPAAVVKLKTLDRSNGRVQLASKTHAPGSSRQQLEQGPATQAPLPSQPSSVHRSKSMSQGAPCRRGVPTQAPLEHASPVWQPLPVEQDVPSGSIVHDGVQQRPPKNPVSQASPASTSPFWQSPAVKLRDSPKHSIAPVSVVPDGDGLPAIVQSEGPGASQPLPVNAPVVSSTVPLNIMLDW
jgi:hypothetical protein